MQFRQFALSIVAAAGLALGTAGCTTPAADTSAVTLSGTLATQTLDATKKYAIDGKVIVPDGVTLTIPAGTVLYGKSTTSWLKVEMGGKLVAEGTAAKPIYFTSAAEAAGLSGAQGQWGGVTILGKGVTNRTSFTYEGDSSAAGGSDDTDNSGTLKYVVIKYTGYEVDTDKELNGLSLVAVGNGTTIDHVASVSSKDDGVEIWGGAVNMTNLYIYGSGDDGYDLDNGYKGTVDGLYIESIAAGSTDPRAMEADSFSNSDGDGDNARRATPTIKNFGIVYNDGEYTQAIYLREGIDATFTNGEIIAKGTSALVVINADDVSSAGTTQGTWSGVTVYSDGTLYKDIDANTTSASVTGITKNAYSTSATVTNTTAAAVKTWGDTYKASQTGL